MNNGKFDLSRYRLLTMLTVILLMCLVSMQAFWLYTSYQKEKDLFQESIDRSLAAAVSAIHLQQILMYASPELSGLLKNPVKTKVAPGKIPGSGRIQGGIVIEVDSVVSDTSSKLLDKWLGELTRSVSNLKNDSVLVGQLNPKLLQNYKLEYDRQLKANGIELPYEIAVLDSNDRLVHASTDTNTLKSISSKTSVGRQHPVNLKSDYLVAAFPDSRAYILKKIGTLLGISIFLIAAGCISFSSLIALFFRQKKLSELRDHFMNNMTHELKTPVTSVGVALEMLEDERKHFSEEKRKALLRVARTELSRLDTLIDHVLELGSTGKSSFELVLEQVELLPWLEDIRKNFFPVLNRTGSTLELNVQPADLSLRLDKTHMTNIIHNLVENAVKYRDANRLAHVIISVTKEDQFVVFRVKDNGMGIPSQYLGKIFDEFFRVPYGDVHNVKGYGLGLSYVKSLVSLHKGSVKVSSVVNTGTIFSIYLPIH